MVCVPISAKEGTNLRELESKIIDLANTKCNLLEDYSVKAQCFIIESHFDERTHQITASVIIKRGVLY